MFLNFLDQYEKIQLYQQKMENLYICGVRQEWQHEIKQNALLRSITSNIIYCILILFADYQVNIAMQECFSL